MRKWTVFCAALILAMCIALAAYADAGLFVGEETAPFAEQAGARAESLAVLDAWAGQTEGMDFEALYLAAATGFPEDKRLAAGDTLEDIVTGPFFHLRYSAGVPAATLGELPRFDLLPPLEAPYSFRQTYDPFATMRMADQIRFYDVGRFVAFARADAPVVFGVIEEMGTTLTGVVQGKDIYTRWYRVSLVNARDGSLVAWFPAVYDETPTGVVSVQENEHGQLVYVNSMSLVWKLLCEHMQMQALYPSLVREGTLVACEQTEGTLTVPEGIVAVGAKAAYGQSCVQVVLPASLERIGEEAFAQCALQSLDIPGSVRHIDDGAFASNNRLEIVVMGEGVESIGEGAFRFCRSLTSVTIPDSVSAIGETAFAYAENVVIHAAPGSYAEAYAQAQGIACVAP